MQKRIFILADETNKEDPLFSERVLQSLGHETVTVFEPLGENWHYSAELVQTVVNFQPHLILGMYPLVWAYQAMIDFFVIVGSYFEPNTEPKHIVVCHRDFGVQFRGNYPKVLDRLILHPLSVLDLKRAATELLQDKADPQLRNVPTSALSTRLQQEEAMATRHLLDHLAHAPQDGFSWSMLGDLYWGLGNFKAALQAYTTAIGCPPDELKACPQHPLQARGLLYQSIGQHGLALKDFLQYNNNIWYYYKYIAESFTALGFFQQAEQAYQSVNEYTLKKNPVLAQQIKFVKAQITHPSPLGLSWSGVQPLPQESPTFLPEILSQAITRTFKSDEGFRPLLEVVEQFPDNPLVWRYLGHAYWYGGHEVEAEAAFAEMVTRDPDSPTSHFIQGCLAYIKQDYEKALTLFQQAEQGALAQADRLQLYLYRLAIQLRLGEAELAEQDKQRYDDLYGQPYFYREWNTEAGSRFFVEQTSWQNEPVPRSPKILILGATKSVEKLFEKYIQTAGYQTKRLSLWSDLPFLLRSQAHLTNQLLAWQPDLILCYLSQELNRFLTSLLYQVRQRQGSAFYPRQIVHSRNRIVPPLSEGIDHRFYDEDIILRETLQKIEQLLQANPHSPLLKRDWSPPTDIDPSEDILDMPLSVFFEKESTFHFQVSSVQHSKIRGYVNNAHTAILTDGRRVPIKLERFTMSTGRPDRSVAWHGYAYLDVPDPESVAILSLIVPAPK